MYLQVGIMLESSSTKDTPETEEMRNLYFEGENYGEVKMINPPPLPVYWVRLFFTEHFYATRLVVAVAAVALGLLVHLLHHELLVKLHHHNVVPFVLLVFNLVLIN